jgi:hypothetical protein
VLQLLREAKMQGEHKEYLGYIVGLPTIEAERGDR